MYISAYEFAGDPTDLHDRYVALMEGFRDDILVHVAVATPTGIVAWDACPDRATAEAFWASDEWRSALAGSGLPTPTITPLGDAIVAVANASVAA
jgi:hypothetical protein